MQIFFSFGRISFQNLQTNCVGTWQQWMRRAKTMGPHDLSKWREKHVTTRHYTSLARPPIFRLTDANSDEAWKYEESDVTCLSLTRHKGLTDWTLDILSAFSSGSLKFVAAALVMALKQWGLELIFNKKAWISVLKRSVWYLCILNLFKNNFCPLFYR
jgi:hypothetical protein